MAATSVHGSTSNPSDEQILCYLPIKVVDDDDVWYNLKLGDTLRLSNVFWKLSGSLSSSSSQTVGSSIGSGMPGGLAGGPNFAPPSSSALGFTTATTLSGSANISTFSGTVGSPGVVVSGPVSSSFANQSSFQPVPGVGPGNQRESIDEIELAFQVVNRREDAEFDILTTTALAVNWYRKPYLNIFVIGQHGSDTYDTAVKSRLKTFIEHCTERRTEYVVLYLYIASGSEPRKIGNISNPSPPPPSSSSSTTSTSSRRFFTTSSQSATEADTELRAARKGFEKVKAMVNVSRAKDRCVFIRCGLDSPTQTQEFLSKLRELIGDAIDSRIHAYHEEIDRVYANRLLPGWSFCSFFALKESLAFVYQQLGRYDYALQIYDELQALFAERNEKLTAGFGGNESGDDGAFGVVDTSIKDYRRRVYESIITELDLRVYLFSRQRLLCLLSKRLHELAERGLRFVNQVSRVASQDSITFEGFSPGEFRDAWVFSAARLLAATVEGAVRGAEIKDGELVKDSDRRTARLVAGFYVAALRAFSSLTAVYVRNQQTQTESNYSLSSMPTWSNASQDPDSQIESPRVIQASSIFSNPDLKTALRSLKDTEQLYTELAFTAASLYELGGRPRGAAALGGDAGLIRLRNGSYREAEGLLSLQCARFISDDGWDSLHRRSRAALAYAEKSLGKVQEYLLSCLAMLIMYREKRRLDSSHDTLDYGDQENHPPDACVWAHEAREAAIRLPRVMKYKLDKLFEVYVLPDTRPWKQGNRATATVVVESDIPAELEFDSMAVELTYSTDRGTTDPQGQAQYGQFGHADDVSVAGSRKDMDTLFALTNKGPIYIKTGTSYVEVSAQEVPLSGKYDISLIVFYLGKLKLVQLAEALTAEYKASKAAMIKEPPTLMFSTASNNDPGKMDKLPKTVTAPPYAKPGGLTTVSKGLLGRFPSFYASDHAKAMSIALLKSHLMLAPFAVQYLEMEIEAGPDGFQEGTFLYFKLSIPEDQQWVSEVTIVDTDSTYPTNDESNKDSRGFMLLSVKSDGFGCNYGTVELKTGLVPMEKLRAKLAVAFGSVFSRLLVPSPVSASDHGVNEAISRLNHPSGLDQTPILSEEARSLDLKCELEIAYSGITLITPKYRFQHQVNLDVTAYNYVHVEIQDVPIASVKASAASDSATPNGDSAANPFFLVFDIHLHDPGLSQTRSCGLELTKASLVLPDAYKVSESQPHQTLIPARIMHGSCFTLSFSCLAMGCLSKDRNISSLNQKPAPSPRRSHFTQPSTDASHQGMLRLEFSSDSVDGTILLERKISTASLLKHVGKIKIERKVPSDTVMAGVPFEILFRVQEESMATDQLERVVQTPTDSPVRFENILMPGKDASPMLSNDVFSFEIEDDCRSWIIFGKTRGFLKSIKDSSSASTSITEWTKLILIATGPGNHELPAISLRRLGKADPAGVSDPLRVVYAGTQIVLVLSSTNFAEGLKKA